MDESAKSTMFPTVFFVVGLIILSWILLKNFHIFEQENTITTLILHPFQPLTILVVFSSLLFMITLISYVGLGWILMMLFGFNSSPGWIIPLIICLVPYLMGAIPLGFLCCLLTSSSSSSTLLFPVIYFPLVTPLTLASIEVYKLLWRGAGVGAGSGVEGFVLSMTQPVGMLITMGGFFALLSAWLVAWATPSH